MTAYRADHVGSFLRPPELLDARGAHAEGRLNDAELREKEDRAVQTILSLQQEIGVDVYSDGEYRRGMWLTGLPAAVDGFGPGAMLNIRNWRGRPLPYVPGQTGARHAAAAGQNPAAVITGKLTPRRRITGIESAFLGRHAPGPFKITIPSPAWYLRGYIPGTSDRVYPTPADALRDLTAIVHREVTALVEERVPYVQIDSIRYVFDYTDEERRRAWSDLGVDPDRAVDENIVADNAAIDGIARDGVTFGLHMCRGNNRSRWFAEGGYDRIAERAFGQLHYDRFLLEYDSDRAGGFAPLRFVPKGKTVVLGLISTKVPQLESQDDLLRRIDEAARYVPVERLALSPQCGFASVAAGNEISWDDQRRKLALLVATARKVWPR
ncbi:MAG TPA: cobalamin-independent methionine synthase II family protein [Candidatus Methylomirabilis sp.]|nr:cobalamin-independent methionine synthase II family protein [Candidatus Methylomirabilis sp.]